VLGDRPETGREQVECESASSTVSPELETIRRDMKQGVDLQRLADATYLTGVRVNEPRCPGGVFSLEELVTPSK
jgi:hypothetical protein